MPMPNLSVEQIRVLVEKACGKQAHNISVRKLSADRAEVMLSVARDSLAPEMYDRVVAIPEFGPMVVTVLSYWGIRSTEDIGHMVFNLIGAGIFGKTEDDSIEDFKNVFDFHEAFVKPFEPENLLAAVRRAQASRTTP